MKRMVKIFFVYLLMNTSIFGAFRNCAWDDGLDQKQIFLESRYQQVRLELQITIAFMLTLLESNKLLLLQLLERQINHFDQEVTLQALLETEWKIEVLKRKLFAS